MDIYYTLHCEAKINGKWENWDLYTFKAVGKYQVIPVLKGKSAVGAALNWYDLISQHISRDEIAAKTLEVHPTDHPEYQDWRVFDYNAFFGDKDFSVQEYAGYMARNVMNTYRAEKDADYLAAMVETDAFITPAQYANLTPEAQRGFEWCEFTQPFGIHDIMRRIQHGVQIRLYATDDVLDGPVRVVIFVS